MFLSTFVLALQLGSVAAQFPFAGKHETAWCPAENRVTHETASIKIRERQPGVELNAPPALISIAPDYTDVNSQAKKTLIFVHGWPGVWSTWRHQIDEFKVRSLNLKISQVGANLMCPAE